MTIVFSTCNGTQSRFESNEPKQLVKVDGTPLLLRTAKQVEDRGHLLYVVTHNKFIIDAVKDEPNLVLLRGFRNEKLVQTLLYTVQWWKDRTIFLLGDVYFSDNAMDKIFSEESDIMFFGSLFELCALVMRVDLTKQMIDTETNSRGKLWHLLRRVCGFGWEEHNLQKLKDSPYFTLIDDETDDIDTLKDYNRLLRKIKEGSR